MNRGAAAGRAALRIWILTSVRMTAERLPPQILRGYGGHGSEHFENREYFL
jgi:hypothetical protein